MPRLANPSKKALRAQRKHERESAKVFGQGSAPTQGELDYQNNAFKISPEWKDDTPVKSREEIEKDRIQKANEGWPWKGAVKRLVSLVWNSLCMERTLTTLGDWHAFRHPTLSITIMKRDHSPCRRPSRSLHFSPSFCRTKSFSKKPSKLFSRIKTPLLNLRLRAKHPGIFLSVTLWVHPFPTTSCIGHCWFF